LEFKPTGDRTNLAVEGPALDRNREKLVPTQKPTRMFGLKLGMQGLSGYPYIYPKTKKQQLVNAKSKKIEEPLSESSQNDGITLLNV
jgi:hypothetical protein